MDNVSFVEIQSRIARGEASIVENLYKECFEGTRQYVVNNSGTTGDARDVFQESLMVLYRNAQKEGWKLTSKPCAFLSGVSRRMWMMRLRATKSHGQHHLRAVRDQDQFFEMELEEENTESQLIKMALDELKSGCRDLLRMFYFGGLNMEEIAKELDTTKDYVKVKKHRCMNQLRNVVRSLQDE